MQFSLNTNPLRKQCSVAKIVTIAKDAGVTGMEWGLNTLGTAATDAALMRKATEDAGLQIVSYINGGQLWKTDEIRRWSEAVKIGGGRVLRVAHPWFAWDYNESVHQPDDFMRLVEMSREGLARLMALGKEFDLRYVLETHSGSCFASPLMVPWVLQEFDPRYCGIIFDPANTILEGFVRLRAAVEIAKPYIAYVHAKNLAWKETTGPNGKPLFTREKRTVDQGMLDYTELMFALKLHGWDGWFSFEEFVTPEPSKVAAEVRAGIAWLQQCRAAAKGALEEPFLQFNR